MFVNLRSKKIRRNRIPRVAQKTYAALIDAVWMAKEYPNFSESDLGANYIFQTCLLRDGYDPNPFFDSDWYLSENKDVSQANIDPLLHYILHGEAEGRQPNPFFDPLFYGENNLDLKGNNFSLLLHYVSHGRFENRSTCRYQFQISNSTNSNLEISELSERIAVLIPVFNNWAFTERCLRAIYGTSDSKYIEIFIVNDGSTDGTLANLSRFPEVQVFNTVTNLGFTKACNFAFNNLLDFDYIYLLNNDTEPQEGFILKALEALNHFPNAKIVGSRFLFSDGSLQESGGVIWSDGYGANYGRGSSAFDPKLNFSRKVDYVSGAGLLIDVELLKITKGFDDIYSPAYYEDTDLCFQTRDLGFDVIVASGSNVIHHEGKSHGTDIESDTGKSFQRTNRLKFVNKWHDVLDSQHFLNNSYNLDIAANRLSGFEGQILWIDAIAPRPLEDSGSLRASWLLRLARNLNFQVIFIPSDESVVSEWASELRNSGIAVVQTPEEAKSIFGNQIDFVWISRYPIIAKHFSEINKLFPTAKIIFDTVDLHGIRELRESELQGSKPMQQYLAKRLLRREIEFANISYKTVVVSNFEADYLSKNAPEADVEIIANVHTNSNFIYNFQETSGLIFIGGFRHSPNVQGIKWFINEVGPYLTTNVKNGGLKIIGSNVPPDILELDRDWVDVVGWVKDTEPYLAKSRISIAPLLYGAGVKGKVGEAFGFGTPVVMTGVAAEGMRIENGHHALIANSASDFAEAINGLYENEDEWNKMRVNGQTLLEDHFSPKNASAKLNEILDFKV